MEKIRIRNFKATEDKILETAICFGARFGLDSLSTLKMSKKLGISEGNIFFHFKTKDSLVAACFKRIKEKINSEVSLEKSKESNNILNEFNLFINFAKKKTTYVKFLSSLYSSKYIKNIGEKNCKFDLLFIEKVKSIAKFSSLEEANSVCLLCMQTTISAALNFEEGIIEDNPSMRKVVYKNIFKF